MQRDELVKNCEEIRETLRLKHQNEEDETVREFEESYPSQPKFSPEVLNLQRMMEGHIKNKDYEKANDTKIKIIRLCSEQDNKWKTEIHDKKLSLELERLHQHQEKEILKSQRRIELAIEEFETRKKEKFEKLSLKHNNRIKLMRNEHRIQLNEFLKPSKSAMIKRIGNFNESSQ